jgi:hypothetical protein
MDSCDGKKKRMEFFDKTEAEKSRFLKNGFTKNRLFSFAVPRSPLILNTDKELLFQCTETPQLFQF